MRLPWKSASADEAYNGWNLDIFDGVDRTTLDATFTPGGTVLTVTGQTRDVFKPPSGRYNIRIRYAYFHNVRSEDFALIFDAEQRWRRRSSVSIFAEPIIRTTHKRVSARESEQAQIADISETDIVFDGNTQLYCLVHIVKSAIQCAWVMKLERTGDA